jgi:hypothetical protein
VTRSGAVGLPLTDLVVDFARAIQSVDASEPVQAPYRPGIGPLPEKKVVKRVMDDLTEADPQRYASHQLEVPYGDGTRQKCDICLGGPEPWEWAIEVKMLRLLGDNEKPNDNMMGQNLSPYPGHGSALTDCTKLLASRLGIHKAILIYGFDHPLWAMDPAIEVFEVLASRKVKLASRTVATFDGLIHPVHQRGRVFGWEVQPQ